MQSINPQDQQSTQIQSVDNLVSEIRQIADHIYQEGAQELAQQTPTNNPQDQQTAHSPRSPHYQSVQPPQESLTLQTEHSEAAKADLKRPPLNPGDISKGLSRLHARVDEVLRRTPQRGLENSTVFDNLNKNGEAQYRSNAVSIRPDEAYKLSHITSSYSSMPKSSTLPANANFTKPPIGTHGPSSISTSTFPHQQEVPYHNPFSENALLRTNEYEARKSMLQNVTGYSGVPATSHLSASAINVAPWSTHAHTVEHIKTQRDDRPFRNPSMLESGIGRAQPGDISGYNPALRDTRFEHSVHSGLGDVHRLSTISTIHTGAPESGLYQSASVPSFKPRYDKSKLDSIIANIRNRESGSSSLYQSQAPTAPNVATSNIYARVQEPVHHDIRGSVKQAAFFSGEVPKQAHYDSVPRTQQDYMSPNRGLPSTTHTPQPFNPLSNSKFVSPPGQFSSPQNVIPISNAYSNPFNQPRHEFETEEVADYYGVFGHPQRDFERERRQGFTPVDEHIQHMTPTQDEVGYRRGYPDQGRGYPEYQQQYPQQHYQQQQYQQQQPYRTPEYDRGYPQQRYRETEAYDRYQEPVQDRYNPVDRYAPNRQEEFAKRMGPSDLKRGFNRREDYGPEAEFAEFQNDDDSLVEDRPPVRAKGRTRKQENAQHFGGLEDDESFVSDRDSFVEQTQPKLRPGRRGASRTRNENRSHREDTNRPTRESGYTDRNMIPKPVVTAPRQEIVRNTERPTRRGASARGGRKAELGGGELVYNGTGDAGNASGVQRKQSFGQEQGRGGSVPRRQARDRDSVNQNQGRDFQVKEETPMRGSRVQESDRGGYGMRNSGVNVGVSGGKQRSNNPKDYLNNEEELSDFDFENRDEVEDNRGRGKASQPAARDEDSVTRAFQNARYESGRRPQQGYSSGRDGVSQKTEMIQGGSAAGRRRLNK